MLKELNQVSQLCRYGRQFLLRIAQGGVFSAQVAYSRSGLYGKSLAPSTLDFDKNYFLLKLALRMKSNYKYMH
jgi:hypothetical protein